MIYRWVSGETVTLLLSSKCLRTTLELIQTAHMLVPEYFPGARLDDAWFHWFSFQRYLTELRKFEKRYGSWLVSYDAEGPHLTERMG